MEVSTAKTAIKGQFTQVAWVVKDIKAAEQFFRDIMGIDGFMKLENFRAQEFGGTYYGAPSDSECHVYTVYSGGTFIELIQPVSGRSIFQDYLDRNPAGGIQHIAYSMPAAKVDAAVAGLIDKGYSVITTMNMPVARVFFIDTYKELGVATEIMGITEAGVEFVQNLKAGALKW